MKRKLILENGTVFIGEALGSDDSTIGEVVFNTGMTGYQEILSDPSYCGQIVTLTYPLIGNYGINRDDFESINPAISGVVVKEVADYPSNWRSELTFDEFLRMKKIPGIADIDTRKLTRIIREHGTLKGALCPVSVNDEEIVKQLKSDMTRNDEIKHVSTKTSYPSPGRGRRVVLIDFGMKHGILRELIHLGCDVIVVPYNISSEEILQLNPDGVLLSNGPGNPMDVQEAIAVVKEIIGKIPLFGIGLGHQLFALACGAKTAKMKFGHRGSSHPVKDVATGKVLLTSQNHGYSVEKDSLSNTRLDVTHIALNDGTVEGLKHKDYSAISVQYEPEASPGSEDAKFIFQQFLEMIEISKQEEPTYAKA